MPTELLAFPPSYTLVGIYRLLTDPTIREPVYAKLKHASVRGAAVGVAYAVFGWGIMNWFVRKFILRGRVGERVTIGAGKFSFSVDLLYYTHMIVLLPQLSRILRFFIKKNLRIARARAYNLTLASRGKPAEFWSQGYVEEWAQPPVPTPEQARAWGTRKHAEPWVRWLLWWPSQMVLKQFILLPLSPTLPLIFPVVISGLRALGTAEYLHDPYFKQKRMTSDEIWRWIEERKWAYRSFGFSASLLEGIPILGLFFSVSNRIGAAMWAFDLEKRQHLFAHGVLKPLPRNMVGLFGSGSGNEINADIVRAEKEIEQRFSKRAGYIPIMDESGEIPAKDTFDTKMKAGPPPPLPPRSGAPSGPAPAYAPALPPRPGAAAGPAGAAVAAGPQGKVPGSL